MGTTIVSIGGVTSAGGTTALDTGAVATLVSSSAPEFVVTWSKTLASTIDIGDIAKATDSGSTTYEYLITAISGTQYTLIQKVGGGTLNQNPATICAAVDEYGDCETIASFSFYRAFSTITLFEGMVDDASPTYWGSSDDVVGECHADSPFTDSRVYFTTKQSLASVTLTVYETDRHDGTASSGVVIRPTAGSGHDNAIIDVNIDNFIIEWIEIDLGSLDSTNTNKAVQLRGTNDDNIIRNNLIHNKGGNAGTNGLFMIHTVGAGSSSDTLSILNNIIYNIVETTDDSSSAININQWQGTVNIYNNTVYNIESDNSASTKPAIAFRYNGHANQVANVKNNIASKLVADTAAEHRAYWDVGTGTSNVDYNLSDDTTNATYEAQGTNRIIDATAAQIDFLSIGVGTENLHLNTDSVCREAGVDLGTTNEVNIDIDGVDRDATDVTWDMGADQASVLGGSAGTAFIMFLDI
tara:strand:- start:176 stop:1579 length:1404 start_codon:yes stop_codon:yes gene_type:complete